MLLVAMLVHCALNFNRSPERWAYTITHSPSCTIPVIHKNIIGGTTDLSDQSTDFQSFNVHSQLFERKGLFTQSRLNSWCRGVSATIELFVAFICAVNLRFLRLLTRMTLSSAPKVALAFPFLGLMWAGFIVVVDGLITDLQLLK